jgi:hypothetical protein
MGLDHSELLSGLWLKEAIAPNTLTSGSTVNSYSASPQPAAGVDSWDSGTLLFEKLLVVIQVSAVTAGTLTVTLRDCQSAITTANGDSVTQLAATLTAISAIGLYHAEINLRKVFSTDATRYTNDADYQFFQRYLSLRAVAAGGNFTFSSLFVFGKNLRSFPSQDSTVLSITWPTS